MPEDASDDSGVEDHHRQYGEVRLFERLDLSQYASQQVRRVRDPKAWEVLLQHAHWDWNNRAIPPVSAQWHMARFRLGELASPSLFHNNHAQPSRQTH